MAKVYRWYFPEQDFLLPPSLREWLPEDHLSYFVSDLIDQLDLSQIEQRYEREERGYPPYHPRMMTEVLVYGYCVDVALAYYKGLLEGNFALQQRAYEELEAIKPELSTDKDALASLGILSEERGDYKQAQKLFQEVIKLDPRNLIAISNLGTLLARACSHYRRASVMRAKLRKPRKRTSSSSSLV